MYIARHTQFKHRSTLWIKFTVAAGIVGLMTLSCAFVGYFYITHLATPQFTATAIIEWNTRSNSAIPTVTIPMGLSEDHPEIQSQVERIKSAPFLLDVIHRHGLTENPEFNPLLRPQTAITRLQSQFGLSFGADADPHLATLTEFQSKLDVLHIPSTQLIQISVTTSNKDLSPQLTNDIVDQFVSTQAAQHITRTKHAMGLLLSRITTLENTQAQLREALAQHTQNAPLLSEEALMAKKAEIVKIELDLQRRTIDQNSRGYQALIAHKTKLFHDVEQHVLDLKKREDLEQQISAIAAEKAVFLNTLWTSEAQSASASSFVEVISHAYTPQQPSSPSIFLIPLFGVLGGLMTALCVALYMQNRYGI